jgi:hypothetical protein
MSCIQMFGNAFRMSPVMAGRKTSRERSGSDVHLVMTSYISETTSPDLCLEYVIRTQTYASLMKQLPTSNDDMNPEYTYFPLNTSPYLGRRLLWSCVEHGGRPHHRRSIFLGDTILTRLLCVGFLEDLRPDIFRSVWLSSKRWFVLIALPCL